MLDLPDQFQLPCPTQTVECTIKVVPEASAKVCGSLLRDEFIKAKLSDRRKLPKFDIKSEYRPAYCIGNILK